MSNEMTAIDALISRNSMALLTGTAISQEHKELMIQAAIRAADHGWLKPTRFIMVEGEQRKKLGQLIYNSTANVEQLTAEKQDKLLNGPLRAPLIILTVHRSKDHPKIPLLEQLLATAASTQNLLNAAWALGLGAIWRTGDITTNKAIAQGLGLAENEQLVGLVYVGERGQAAKALPQHQYADFVTELQL